MMAMPNTAMRGQTTPMASVPLVAEPVAVGWLDPVLVGPLFALVIPVGEPVVVVGIKLLSVVRGVGVRVGAGLLGIAVPVPTSTVGVPAPAGLVKVTLGTLYPPALHSETRTLYPACTSWISASV